MKLNLLPLIKVFVCAALYNLHLPWIIWIYEHCCLHMYSQTWMITINKNDYINDLNLKHYLICFSCKPNRTKCLLRHAWFPFIYNETTWNDIADCHMQSCNQHYFSGKCNKHSPCHCHFHCFVVNCGSWSQGAHLLQKMWHRDVTHWCDTF